MTIDVTSNYYIIVLTFINILIPIKLIYKFTSQFSLLSKKSNEDVFILCNKTNMITHFSMEQLIRSTNCSYYNGGIVSFATSYCNHCFNYILHSEKEKS